LFVFFGQCLLKNNNAKKLKLTYLVLIKLVMILFK